MSNSYFFKIPRDEILTKLEEKVVRIYKSAGYLDFTAGDLYIAQNLLEKKGREKPLIRFL